MGVPSRMNLGQVLETHLGWAAAQGWEPFAGDSPAAKGAEPWTNVATPVFDGAREEEILKVMENARPNRDGSVWSDPTARPSCTTAAPASLRHPGHRGLHVHR
jgi:DNA-directed RNA polymerase beta subunit